MIYLKTIRNENTETLSKRFNELIAVLEGLEPESNPMFRPNKILTNNNSYKKSGNYSAIAHIKVVRA